MRRLRPARTSPRTTAPMAGPRGDGPLPSFARDRRMPDAERAGGYTWCKAPRLDRAPVVEIGALARQLVDGHPLIRDLAAGSGGNVHTRVIARLSEVARLRAARWSAGSRHITPERAVLPARSRCPTRREGAGLIEAARGSLGHWLEIRKGRIVNYQIIAPTTWNFSPRERAGASRRLRTGARWRAGPPRRDRRRSPCSTSCARSTRAWSARCIDAWRFETVESAADMAHHTDVVALLTFPARLRGRST